MGGRVAQIGLVDSSMQRIAKAVAWLRANFFQPMKVEALAGLAHMSVSSFHQHFKSATSMSPLQYQKVLRLQEAKHLLLSTRMDAGTANRQVGYLTRILHLRGGGTAEKPLYFSCLDQNIREVPP